jgi:glycosyltransferase involved in cell wall biosynthesis
MNDEKYILPKKSKLLRLRILRQFMKFRKSKFSKKILRLKPRICIVTRNAVHGGVESLIKSETKYLNAKVIVTGGLNNPYSSCPFNYLYVNTYYDLMYELYKYDVCIYHFIPEWAVKAVKMSNIFSIEFVHRTDTSECDKMVPTLIASHSQYVLDYINKDTNRHSELFYVPNGIDTERFIPVENRTSNKYIGAVTSYFTTKGIDVLIKAWQKVDKKYKKKYSLKLMGAGGELENLKSLANNDKTIELLGSTTKPEELYNQLILYVTAARIEGLPLSVLEALSSNLPVIASNIEGHKVINETATKNGFPEPLILFKSEDSSVLAKKIESYLNNPYNVNTRPMIEKLYSIKDHCNGLKNLIDNYYYKC